MGKDLTLDDCRPLVRKMALEMERQLRANDYKGGWDVVCPGYLQYSLMRNLAKLHYEIVFASEQGRDALDGNALRRRAANIANYAAMIVDVMDAWPGTRPEE